MPSNTELLETIKTETAPMKALVQKAASLEEVQVELVDRLDKIEEAHKELRRNAVPGHGEFVVSGTHLRNRALHNGSMRMSYKQLIELSPEHGLVKGTDAEGQIRTIHLYHDACLFKYWHYKRKFDHTAAVQWLRKAPEYSAYKKALAAAGYGTEEAIDATLDDSTKVMRDPYGRVEKANEIPYDVDNLGDTTAGTNLIFTLLSATLIELIRIELVLLNFVRTIPLTRASQSFPTLLSDAMGVLGGVTATTEPPVTEHPTVTIPPVRMFDAPTFGKLDFDVKHCMGFIQWNDDMVEDSIIPWVPMMREQVARSIARAKERSFLDGDLAATHMDLDVTVTNDFRKAYHGLRKAALTNHAVNHAGARLTPAAMRLMRQDMGKYGRDSNRVKSAITVRSWYELLHHDDVMTVDTYGPSAVIHTGQLGSLDNIPLLMSEFVRDDIGATGAREASANTFAVAYMWNQDQFAQGTFGSVAIESTRNAPLLHTVLQIDQRIDLQSIQATTAGVLPAGASPGVMVRNIDEAA